MLGDRYKLVGKKAIPCRDLLAWAKWFDKADRKVAQTQVGQVGISTVFLGLNHNLMGLSGNVFLKRNRPVLFETMVFGGKLDGETRRYRTWKEAESGHKEVVKLVEESERPITKRKVSWR